MEDANEEPVLLSGAGAEAPQVEGEENDPPVEADFAEPQELSAADGDAKGDDDNRM